MQSRKGSRSVRRYGWQIGGLGVAVAAVVALGLLAFGCGSSGGTPPRAVSPSASASVRASATADPRVAEVEAAARRYVQALADSMRTGSPDELDSLSVPGSQAEGNAGVAAGIVQRQHVAFVTTSVAVSKIDAQVASSAAVVTVDYTFTGFDADWPSLKRRDGTDRTISAHTIVEFTLVSGKWLAERVR